MTSRLQIPRRRERLAVRLADAALAPWRRRRRPTAAPARVLVLRLERIGDLLMSLPAVASLRAALPSARIDLVVGSWNAELARTIPGIDAVETLDASWLSRGAGGLGPLALAAHARAWRARGYDLGINFEPDIRSNLALRAGGARTCVGYASGGGGPLLDIALDYDRRAHVAENARSLVGAALGHAPPPADARLDIPEAARREADGLVGAAGARLLVGVHVSAGRLVKQWPPDRFGEVAARLAGGRGAALVFTGDASDRVLVEAARERVAGASIDLAGRIDLVTLAAVIERLDLVITGDTGPMHLACAVGTPVVAVFGPSDPARYGPTGTFDRIVRIDLPCSPCNRIRVPPARCTGHTPDCLEGVAVARVMAAVDEVLDARRPDQARPAR